MGGGFSWGGWEGVVVRVVEVGEWERVVVGVGGRGL